MQVAGWALILGIIALSLSSSPLGRMVSLVQMNVAGVSGYMITVFGAGSASDDQPVLAVVGRRADRDRDRGRLRKMLTGVLFVAHKAFIRS